MSPLKSLVSLVTRVYALARPYGRGRLAIVFLVVLAQGFFQMVGSRRHLQAALNLNPDDDAALRRLQHVEQQLAQPPGTRVPSDSGS